MNKLAAYAVVVVMSGAPALAGDGRDDIEDGMGLLSEGTRLLLRGLIGEIEPALRELEGAIIDLNAYELPEVLPNGDILIRRKRPAPPGSEIEL